MKHLIYTTLATVLLACGCQTTLDIYWMKNVEHEIQIEEHQRRLSTLDSIVTDFNITVTSLRESIERLRDLDNITAINNYYEGDSLVGYIIKFKYSDDLIIRNGKDGNIPSISFSRESDGYFYWRIDGELVFNNDGKPIRCEGSDGITPVVRINGDNWEVSYDLGLSWGYLDRAVADSTRRSIKKAEKIDNFVLFTTKDNIKFALPCSLKQELNIENIDTTQIAPLSTLSLKYNVTNATDATVVSPSAESPYTVTLDRESNSIGTININTPKYYEDTVIHILLSDGCGYIYIYDIIIKDRRLSFGNNE